MYKIYLFLFMIFSTMQQNDASAQVITTIAGTGTPGYNGDNMAATSAQLYKPAGISVNSSGIILIADFLNNRVRKIDNNGIISTVAGNGGQGYNGDNIPATTAALYSPVAITIDAAGTFYFCDGNNNRIRRVTTSGVISTIAGTGSFGYNGDNISGTSAQVNYPTDGIAQDANGNLYFSDTYNHRIRKININTGIITTYAGIGSAGYNGDNIAATSAQLNYPYGLTFDVLGNLFICDGGNNRVRKISTSGTITTVAGNGIGNFNGDNILATTASLNDPQGVVVDPSGNIFIADTYNNRIRKVNTSGMITTVAGNGTAGYNGDNIPPPTAMLNIPVGLAIDANGNLLIADLGNSRIRKVANLIILPLTLNNFTAKANGNNAILHWQTSNENNTQNFEIEASFDGKNFSELGSLKALNTGGTNSYQFTDTRALKGEVFYRLKMVDKDGKFTYSNIVSLKFGTFNLQLSISPNPAKNYATVTFYAANAEKFVLNISDISGKTIKQINGLSIIGTNKLNIDLQNIANGMYFVSHINADQTKTGIKFIKD